MFFRGTNLWLDVKRVGGVDYKGLDTVGSLTDFEVVKCYSISKYFGTILVTQISNNEMSSVDWDQTWKIWDREKLLVDDWEVFCADSEAGTIGFLDQGSHYAILVEPQLQI